MKIALAQIDCHVGNVDANLRKCTEYAARSKTAGCDVVAFPEMSDTGYVTSLFPECAQQWPGKSYEALSAAAKTNSIAVVGGISERVGDTVYNSIAFFDPTGHLLGKYRKTHLYSPAPVNEDKYCAAGNELSLVDFGGMRWGLTICYDLRFPELYRALMLRGATVLLNCTAWPAFRPTHWDYLTRARAIENQAFFVGVNRVGIDGELTMLGHSRVVTPMGEVVAEGSVVAEELVVAEMEPRLIDEFRAMIPAIASRRPDVYDLGRG
jgi:predicted amidohydrolase